MRSHDYTKEVGLPSTERTVPLPVTLAVLALVAVSGAMFVKQVYAQPTHGADVPVPAAGRPAR